MHSTGSNESCVTSVRIGFFVCLTLEYPVCKRMNFRDLRSHPKARDQWLKTQQESYVHHRTTVSNLSMGTLSA